MRSTIRWMGQDTMQFVARSGSGHLTTMDGAPEGGGEDLAPRPMEIVLAGAGGCSAYDVVVILKKNGQDVRGCEVALDADRAETDPKVFTAIRMHFKVTGRDLKPSLVERAIKLSHDKYCSATAMLGRTAEITVDWEIIDDR
jgi:putative redox protein